MLCFIRNLEMEKEAENGWRDVITEALKASPEGKPAISAGFNSPADEELIAQTQSELGVLLPDDLSDLLAVSDGVRQTIEVSGSDLEIGYLVWTIERIRDENKRLRTSEETREAYMSFDDLLFFADAGNGDLFGFSIQDGKVLKKDIYVWNHEDDSRTWVAPSLTAFIEWWVSGRIAV